MSSQTVFKRYELKYLLTRQQQAAVLEAMAPHMALDSYGRTTVRNLYFDTGTYRLIRHSIDRPAYKEKLRIRSYRPAGGKDTVYVELKKKFDKVVYKRRIPLPLDTALQWLAGEIPCPTDSQISREIDYFRDYYGDLHPVIFLSYDREAYYTKEPSNFRVTFDENIRCRRNDLSLAGAPGGMSILPQDTVLMEIKCDGGIPLWMVDILSREKLYKTSFSKYGTAYTHYIYPTLSNQEAAL